LKQGIALAFAKAGAPRLVLASRSIAKLESTKQELVKINPNIDVLVVQTDITSEKSVDLLADAIKTKFGTPDILVNGAGLWSSTEMIGESNPTEWWQDFVSKLVPIPWWL